MNENDVNRPLVSADDSSWSAGDDFTPSDALPRAGIHIGAHGNAVEFYAHTLVEAQRRRDFVLTAIAARQSPAVEDFADCYEGINQAELMNENLRKYGTIDKPVVPVEPEMYCQLCWAKKGEPCDRVVCGAVYREVQSPAAPAEIAEALEIGGEMVEMFESQRVTPAVSVGSIELPELPRMYWSENIGNCCNVDDVLAYGQACIDLAMKGQTK